MKQEMWYLSLMGIGKLKGQFVQKSLAVSCHAGQDDWSPTYCGKYVLLKGIKLTDSKQTTFFI